MTLDKAALVIACIACVLAIVFSGDSVDDVVFPDLEAFAELYNYTSEGFNFSLAAPATYYNFTGLSLKQVRNFSYSDPVLTANVSGLYKVSVHVSFSGGGGSNYGLGVANNGVIMRNCYVRRQMGSSGDVGVATIDCMLNVSFGDEITLQVDDENVPAQDIKVYGLDMNFFKLTD